MKTYRLTAADGSEYQSPEPGTLGGYRPLRIYGRLDCTSANRHLANGHYRQHRVFFSGEPEAIAAGYRPCGKCMPEQYAIWKTGGTPGSTAYPWHKAPGRAPGLSKSCEPAPIEIQFDPGVHSGKTLSM